MGQMDGKVAIVTGSGRGIGKEIALRLVRDGAKVVINDIDEAPAKETIAEIERTRKLPASIAWSSPQDGYVLERNAI